MTNPQLHEPIALYTCQFWQRHFLNKPAYQRLEDAALGELHDREFSVNEFWPDSFLGKIRCKLRSLTEPEVIANGRPNAFRNFVCIEFGLLAADLKGLEKVALSSDAVPDKVSLEEFVHWSLVGELGRFCDMLLFLVQITYLGPLHLNERRVQSGAADDGASTTVLARLAHWPAELDILISDPSPYVTLDQTLDWSKSCGGLWSGAAVTPLEKAISFLSHTFNAAETVSEVSLLLWSTAGLEAVACDGNASISWQLKCRLPLICGALPFRNLEKLVTEAYAFRSRVFHGDVPTPNSFNDEVIENRKDQPADKISKYGGILQLVLLAIVWRAISEKSNDLTFFESANFSSKTPGRQSMSLH